jgi:SAM-dependent methyltransferase
MTSSSLSPTCPICGSSQAALEDVLSVEGIVRAWKHLGVELGAEARRSLPEVGEVRRWRCLSCRLAHFDPVLPGNGAFYADLQRQLPDYYELNRPAFGRALRFARVQGLNEVLDVGCGSGAFLDQAAKAGLKTFGLDLNPQGVALCRQQGHDVHPQTAADFFAQSPDRRFDLVTSFEVMEHVPGPAAFFRSAASLVRPGGALVVSVPNDEGVPKRARLLPHQWPPHHLTLWRRENLERLARENGLQVVGVEVDRLSAGLLRYYLQVQGELEHLLGRREGPPGRLGPRLAGGLYRLTGASHWMPPMGTSMTLIARKG